MGKIKTWAAVMAAGVALSALNAAAFAQQGVNSLAPAQASVVQTVSAADIEAMLAGYSVTTQRGPTSVEGGVVSIVATTPGNAQFFITLINCSDLAGASGCPILATFTAWSNSGLSYDDLNSFNSKADVTKAVNVAEQNLVVFRTQQFLQGGVTKANVADGIVRFLGDMQQFVEERRVAGTQVSAKVETLQAAPSKISGTDRAQSAAKLIEENIARLSAAQSSGPVINERSVMIVEEAVAAAIGNTADVQFLSGD